MWHPFIYSTPNPLSFPMQKSILTLLIFAVFSTLSCSQARYGHLTVRSSETYAQGRKAAAKSEHQPQTQAKLEPKGADMALSTPQPHAYTNVKPLAIQEEVKQPKLLEKLIDASPIKLPIQKRIPNSDIGSENGMGMGGFIVMGVIVFILFILLLVYLGVSWQKILLYLILAIFLSVLFGLGVVYLGDI